MPGDVTQTAVPGRMTRTPGVHATLSLTFTEKPLMRQCSPWNVRFLLFPAVLVLPVWPAAWGATARDQVVSPFEKKGGFTPANRLDELALKTWTANGVRPANLCSDTVFLRRVYLDLLGVLPTPDEWLQFVWKDTNPDKRARLIDTLLKRTEFADYWALHWSDVLRIKAEFPINLWPNAVQAYHRWVYESVRDNKPYDRFVRQLLTSSGSNFRVPPVNFYRAVQGRKPATLAAAAALTFMGTRIDKWPPERRAGFAALFSRVAFKGTAEWKEEIVYPAPAPTSALHAVLPDGTKVTVPPGQDPRRVFADWLIQPDNPWFARNLVNRVWSWLFGRGIIHEPDDIRPGNPPVLPAVLTYLEGEFVKSRYDVRHVIRILCNSSVYQQSAIPRSEPVTAERFFACYPVRRLEAEVLSDALCWLFADGESYSSKIPEPFTWIPEDHRTVQLADGSITNEFLERFGRPPRDTGLASERSNEPSDRQRLYLLNSSTIQRRIQRSGRFRGCVAWAKGRPGKTVDALYVNILSREPTPQERETALTYFKSTGSNRLQHVADLAWALINTKEFLYRH